MTKFVPIHPGGDFAGRHSVGCRVSGFFGKVQGLRIRDFGLGFRDKGLRIGD